MRLLFLVPIYKEDPIYIYKHIRKFFPDSIIIFQVDDRKKDFPILITNDNNVKIFFCINNVGLARTLINGYKNACNFQYDYLVRIDSDLEYTLNCFYHNHPILIDNKCLCYGFRRTFRNNGFFDSLFNYYFGLIEGLIIFGKPIMQHSPSLIIMPRDIVLIFSSKAEKFLPYVKNKWGFDLITLFWLNRNYGVSVLSCPNNDWNKRRPYTKIFQQASTSIKVLFFYSKYINYL